MLPTVVVSVCIDVEWRYARHELALDADTADVATTFEVSTCTHSSIQLHSHIDYAADIYSSIDVVYCGTGLC